MSLFKSLLGLKDKPVESYADFWSWFQNNEKKFFEVVRKGDDVDKNFFRKLSPKINELREGLFYLTGMFDDHTVELVITADGTVRNFVFVEELVSVAPAIKGWRFTAHKPSLDVENVNIAMDGHDFNKDNISFYSNDDPDYPDEIDITVIHSDFNETSQQVISNGVFIFLDNFLGELNFSTTIDNVNIIGTNDARKELVPIEKLKDFLRWREKEFIEKYQGTRHNTENDKYSMLEAELEGGKALVAVVNTDLLEWDCKASHPWILNVAIKYDGSLNNGMPDKGTYTLLDEIEQEMLKALRDSEGYLNIGRQTADGERIIFFACNDFRKPPKV
jgi:hypothetical protein